MCDLAAVPLGYTELGDTWFERILCNHWLVSGSMGAGKSSIPWALVYALAPEIRAGLVEVYGIDPKGGMELTKVPAAFRQLMTTNGIEAVELIEHLAEETQRRSVALAATGHRKWFPGCGLPYVILIVDELAAVVAYQRDKKLKERATLGLELMCSQGRAPAVSVVGEIQDPRKEILSFRHLFPTRMALRLDEPVQVDMVLGDGVRARGAFAHEIPPSMPGTAWVKVDGRREPQRVRAFHMADPYLDYLNGYLSRPTQLEVQ